jgi:hypothetical protein
VSAAVCIEWLRETVATCESVTIADMDAARAVAAVSDPEAAAVIHALMGVFAMEQSDTWPPMPAPRTPAEQAALDASMRVAMAPDPTPGRSRPVRGILAAAWAELEGGPRVDRVVSAKVMRSASAEDRGLLMALRGAR